MRAILAATCALLLLAPVGRTEDGEAGALSQLVRLVAAPGATCMAVQDEVGILVVGQDKQPDRHLSVFFLDAQGEIRDGQPAPVLLPKPDSLKDFESYPLGLALHPTLPVLYVWQDIRGPQRGTPQEAAVFAEFDHLAVFRAGPGGLELLGAFGRGEEFAYGQTEGALTVSADGKRLFVPNLVGPKSAQTPGAIGYYDLDEAGSLVPVPVPIEGSLDGHGVNKFDMQIRPTWVYTGGWQPLPTGLGFVAPSRRVVVFCRDYGPCVWDTEDRREALSAVHVRGMGRCRVGGHYAAPAIYGVVYGGDRLFMMEHADGFPTLLPQLLSVPGAQFQSRPVAFKGRYHGVVVGGVNRVHVVHLDDGGRFTGAWEDVPVPQAAVRALDYSRKHDRLFVAVDKVP